MNYLNSLNYEKKEYFKILCSEFPEFLLDYINTKEMQRINDISISCGMDYSSIFNIEYFFSNLDHSVGVALIIWNFTHDKKQTLAGLFHDIATPVFKHSIDFMNGDSETQESTEKMTLDFILKSEDIMKLLKKDGIKVEEIADYHIYPIADNETPKLSADRFEYTFSSGLTFFRVWNLELIKKYYNNIIVVKNEDNTLELAFKDKTICEEYIDIISKLWPMWISSEDRICMQFIADICREMCSQGYLKIQDLYSKSEEEVINIIKNCENKKLSSAFINFQNQTKSFESDNLVYDKYCISVKAKKRYINPLVDTANGPKRISEVSKRTKVIIDNYLNIEQTKYIYFDFEIEENTFVHSNPVTNKHKIKEKHL